MKIVATVVTKRLPDTSRQYWDVLVTKYYIFGVPVWHKEQVLP